MTRHCWIDASAGIAGDMLLGALLDAGASLETVREAVHAVVRDAVRVESERTSRAGLQATRAIVTLLDEDPLHRTWRQIDHRLSDAELDQGVREQARAVFRILAEAEARYTAYRWMTWHSTRWEPLTRSRTSLGSARR